jgi:hypothetical protein
MFFSHARVEKCKPYRQQKRRTICEFGQHETLKDVGDSEFETARVGFAGARPRHNWYPLASWLVLGTA